MRAKKTMNFRWSLVVASGMGTFRRSALIDYRQQKQQKQKNNSAGEVQYKVRKQCSDRFQHAFGRTAAQCGSQLPTAIYPHRA